MEEKYIQLFSKINYILLIQKEQKQRGINDYNMVSVVRKPTHEVGMHSNVLYSLLNPKGLHYQGRLFLDLFIQHVLGLPLSQFNDDVSIEAEEHTNTNKRIDFTLKSSQSCVGIEMKINANDSENQISDYYKHLSTENQHNQITPQMYYLTKFGHDADPKSKGVVPVMNISFSKDILHWLTLCQKEVNNITNLNIAFDNYIEIVKKITKQYRKNIMQIEEELVKEKQHLPAVLTLFKKENAIKAQILHSFFKNVECFVNNNDYSLIAPISKHSSRELIDTTWKAKIEIEDCKNWFLSNSSNKIHGIGLFIDCNLNNDMYLHIHAATKNLHIGIVKCEPTDKHWHWIDIDQNESKGLVDFIVIQHRSWKNFPDWYSIDCGNIFSMEPSASQVEGLLSFSGSKLEGKLQQLIKHAKQI